VSRAGVVMRTSAAAVGLVALIAGAALVRHVAPGPDDWQDPIRTSGEIGGAAAGRNLEVEVRDVRVARTLTDARGWPGETNGVWVVVDLEAHALVDSSGALLTSLLEVDGATYTSSERPERASAHRRPLEPGIALTGSVAFEVPEGALDESSAELQFSVSTERRLDSVLVFPLDLGDIRVVNEIELEDRDEVVG
jgi:hypothetical protein